MATSAPKTADHQIHIGPGKQVLHIYRAAFHTGPPPPDTLSQIIASAMQGHPFDVVFVSSPRAAEEMAELSKIGTVKNLSDIPWGGLSSAGAVAKPAIVINNLAGAKVYLDASADLSVVYGAVNPQRDRLRKLGQLQL